MSDHPRPKRPRSPSHPADHGDGSAEYEVGYGRTPVASRFKPGQCGNPKGRPKKDKSLAAAIERELDQRVTVRENGQPKRVPKRELAARQLTDAACKGSLPAIRTLHALTGMPGKSAAGSSPGQAQAVGPVPMDQDDSAILAAFAALIRSSGTLPDEAEPSLQDEACAVDREATAPALDAPASTSPTRH